MITLLSKGWSLARSSEVILNDRELIYVLYMLVLCVGEPGLKGLKSLQNLWERSINDF